MMGSMLSLLFWLLDELLGLLNSALFWLTLIATVVAGSHSLLRLRLARHRTASSQLPGTHAVIVPVCNYWGSTGELFGVFVPC